jgi:hypothetical protein
MEPSQANRPAVSPLSPTGFMPWFPFPWGFAFRARLANRALDRGWGLLAGVFPEVALEGKRWHRPRDGIFQRGTSPSQKIGYIKENL